jgi:hypothetical protein
LAGSSRLWEIRLDHDDSTSMPELQRVGQLSKPGDVAQTLPRGAPVMGHNAPYGV